MHTRSVRRPVERPVKRKQWETTRAKAAVHALGKCSRSISWALLFGMIIPTTVILGTVSLWTEKGHGGASPDQSLI